jgi:hypothetical protein
MITTVMILVAVVMAIVFFSERRPHPPRDQEDSFL